MNHTPGPWHVGMRPGPMVYGPEGEQVANMHVAMLEQDEHKANAQLIAQAPAMLAALQAIFHECDQVYDGSPSQGAIAFCLETARKALEGVNP